MRFLTKRQSVGPTVSYGRGAELITEAPKDSRLFLKVFLKLTADRNKAVAVGECALVLFEVDKMGKIQKPFDESVGVDGFANVVSLPTVVLPVRVGEEEDAAEGEFSGGEADKGAVGLFPDGVKFCLDKDARPLPDGPSYLLFAAVTGEMPFYDRETFAGFLVRQGIVRDVLRLLVVDDGAAELEDVGLEDFRRDHVSSAPNVIGGQCDGKGKGRIK